MSEPSWKKMMLLFLQPMLELHIPGGFKTMTTALSTEGNANSSYLRTLGKQDRLKEGLQIFHGMDQPMDSFTYARLLQGCIGKKSLTQGKLVHSHITGRGFKPDIILGTILLTMYAKCGSLVDARTVFEQMPNRNVVSWTVMITAYASHGQAEDALTLFYQMQRSGIQPNRFTFAGILPACADLSSLEQGKKIHEEIIRCGFQSDVFVGNALVDMYAKCSDIKNARHVFDIMPQRDVVLWTTMIVGYVQNGLVDEALKLFQKIPQRDVVSWNAMISGYVQNGHIDEALKLFGQMQLTGVKPSSKTFAGVLPACANLGALEKGKELHEDIIKNGFQSDVFVSNALVDMYAKCGNVEIARNLFDNMFQRDIVSWTTMIAGYAQNEQREEALKLFRQMQLAGMKPDSKTFTSILPACANTAYLEQGMEIHEEIIRSGFHSFVFVGNALVDMYAKCGSMQNACCVFDKMPQRDVVSWTTMIAAYAQNGLGEKALKIFRCMQLASVKPDSKTFTSVLPACANLAALELGKEIHEEIIRNGFHSDVFVGSALVDMYAKCGSIENAHTVFDRMHQRNVVSWNAMIAGYAMHGCASGALKLFEQMHHSGTNPDHVTLVCVLSACCHAGLLDEGWQYFDCMSQYYHITPAIEHYGCMVNLLSRAGHLDEAQDFINKMPIKPDASVWGCLLGACRVHNNIELGERVAEHLFELDPQNATPYVLLSNIYASAGRWDDIEMVRKMMKDRRVRKKPGCSWIDVNKQVSAFLVGDIV
eukprot:Gb_35886 [translate_table: standard]